MGHSEAVSIAGPLDDSGQKNGIQQIGSTITYLERYTLMAIMGLAAHDQDDDGIASGLRKEAPARQPRYGHCDWHDTPFTARSKKGTDYHKWDDYFCVGTQLIDGDGNILASSEYPESRAVAGEVETTPEQPELDFRPPELGAQEQTDGTQI